MADKLPTLSPQAALNQRTLVYAAVLQGLLTSGTNRGSLLVDMEKFAEAALAVINR